MIKNQDLLTSFLTRNVDLHDHSSMINNYRGVGGYAKYDHCNDDGYPLTIMDVMSANGIIFHNVGFYTSFGSMIDTIANNLSFVTRDGLVTKVSGTGENCFSKIRYISRSSIGYVYNCCVGIEWDIRMVINGYNCKVFQGAPGVYEINGDKIMSYNYEGPFCYETPNGEIISAYCYPIYYCSPEDFGYDVHPDYVGVQVVCENRVYNWYFDDVHNYLITSIVSRNTVMLDNKTEITIPDEIIAKSMQYPELGKGVYFDMAEGKVPIWIGYYVNRRSNQQVFDMLWQLFMAPYTPPKYTIQDECSLSDIVYYKDEGVNVTPYAKSVSSFLSVDAKVFNNTKDLWKFLSQRDRPYTLMSLVSSLVRRGLLVNPILLIKILQKAGIYVYGTGLVTHKSGVSVHSDLNNLCKDISRDYFSQLKFMDYPWFSLHRAKRGLSHRMPLTNGCLVKIGSAPVIYFPLQYNDQMVFSYNDFLAVVSTATYKRQQLCSLTFHNQVYDVEVFDSIVINANEVALKYFVQFRIINGIKPRDVFTIVMDKGRTYSRDMPLSCIGKDIIITYDDVPGSSDIVSVEALGLATPEIQDRSLVYPRNKHGKECAIRVVLKDKQYDDAEVTPSSPYFIDS